MLCGKMPFDADRNQPQEGIYKDIAKKVQAGKFDLENGIWKEISDDAKDLIKRMLTKDIKKRITAPEALKHPWISKRLKKYAMGYQSNLRKAMQNLEKFNVVNKLEQLSVAYMVHGFITSDENAKLHQVFSMLDEDKNGQLEFEELWEAFQKVTEEPLRARIKRIFDTLDADGNGSIDYNEFLTAACNKKDLFTQKNIREVFDFLDLNRDGKISIKEIRQLIKCEMHSKSYRDLQLMVAKVDADGDQ